jgi:hypothetical protein
MVQYLHFRILKFPLIKVTNLGGYFIYLQRHTIHISGGNVLGIELQWIDHKNPIV